MSQPRVDAKNRISSVQRPSYGVWNPIHVQRNTWGKTHYVMYEQKEYHQFCQRSDSPFNLCKHVYTLDYCGHTVCDESLRENVICNFFGEAKMFKSLQFSFCPSVFEHTKKRFSRLGRIVATSNVNNNTWYYPCTKPCMSCPHKNISKWHLFQTNRWLTVNSLYTGKVQNKCHLSTWTRPCDGHENGTRSFYRQFASTISLLCVCLHP